MTNTLLSLLWMPFFFFSFFFFVVLGFEVRTLFARQASYHLNHAPSPFCFSYFSNSIFALYAWASLDHSPPIYTPKRAGMMGACHYTHLLMVEIVSL
jgi:hypothetical protein